MSTAPPKVEVTHASDYATLDVGPFEAYYGYEYDFLLGQEPADDAPTEQTWGFVVRRDKKVVFARPYADLVSGGRRDPAMFECVDCLLLGLGQYLAEIGAV